MSAPVDVLAVLRYNAREATKKWGPDNQDAATLSAVAELIEADAVFHDLLARMRAFPSTILESAIRRAERRAAKALARVKGGAA
ncbi:hypothetical protein ABE543_06985 [Stenotrophomonas sp. TWI169]|uniref:hypothetical protein n=1 Tax=Stenotrophomonas sp. TWI169 TaxID=3136773 RepID=UPI003208B490